MKLFTRRNWKEAINHVPLRYHLCIGDEVGGFKNWSKMFFSLQIQCLKQTSVLNVSLLSQKVLSYPSWTQKSISAHVRVFSYSVPTTALEEDAQCHRGDTTALCGNQKSYWIVNIWTPTTSNPRTCKCLSSICSKRSFHQRCTVLHAIAGYMRQFACFEAKPFNTVGCSTRIY